MSTYRRAIEWKIPLVSILWIEACKKELQTVPLEGFEPPGIEEYKEALPLYKVKTRIRRPVTDSKLLAKLSKFSNHSDKATQAAVPILRPSHNSNVESERLVEALNSVAGNINKASQQIEQILTSPILQKANKPEQVENVTRGEMFRKSRKQKKKLTFGSSNHDESKKTSVCNSSITRLSNELNNEIRVSYDSDDMLVYAKKQAADTRCSAPPRLITSRKCKKLLSSTSKYPNEMANENDNITKPKASVVASSSITTRRKSKSQQLPTQQQEQSGINRNLQREKNTENRITTRKRKLLLPAQTIEDFKQDSRESTPDLNHECPYKLTQNKKQKTTVSSKTKTARPLAPLISSDFESDDSLTRAARRESSALFVKKQKKVNSQRSIPTIACTSLHRSDVKVVESIVSSLGKFVVERTVSERTTHVVTNSPRRTINLLKGIARGCWILNVKWIYESLESSKWLHEERFELLEFSSTVRQSRIERQAFGPEFNLELFKGLGPIYVCRATMPPASDLMELIRLCGGTVVSSARVAKIIIGASIPFSPNGHNPLMVKEKWILDSITQLCQLNPQNYIYVVPES